jgi:hypothetical protein
MNNIHKARQEAWEDWVKDVDRITVSQAGLVHILYNTAFNAGWKARNEEVSQLQDALLKIADWENQYGPYPETNEDWGAMAIVTARKLTKENNDETN